MEHRDGHVRAAALRTLSWVARVGDVEVMAKVGLPVMKVGDAHWIIPMGSHGDGFWLGKNGRNLAENIEIGSTTSNSNASNAYK